MYTNYCFYPLHVTISLVYYYEHLALVAKTLSLLGLKT